MLRLIIGALSVCSIINTFVFNHFLIIYIVLSTNIALQFTRVYTVAIYTAKKTMSEKLPLSQW